MSSGYGKPDVSISLVVICDTRVLIETYFGKDCFPYDYYKGKGSGGSIQESCSRFLKGITEFDQPSTTWIPVDVRSGLSRKNTDGKYSLDVGFLAILDAPDLPLLPEYYNWELVNLDDPKFPIQLDSDHDQLWDAARNMFLIMK